LLSGLTSAVPCFLLPFFIVKACLTKHREAAVLSGILLAATLMQGSAALSFLWCDHAAAHRPGPPSAGAFAKTFLEQDAVWPIFGGYLSEKIIPNRTGRMAVGVGILLLAIVLGIWSRHRSQQLLILGGYFFVGLLSIRFSVEGGGGWRYAYAPSIMLVTFFVRHVHLIGPGAGKLGQCVCLLLVSAALLGWAYQYRTALFPWVVRDRPSWRGEVAIWRRSPDHRLLISPQWDNGKWSLALPAAKTIPEKPF
jgi:hypothetical protein